MPDKKDLNIGTAGERSVVIGKSANQPVIVSGDDNIVNVTYQGTQLAIPSPEAVAAHRAALKKQLQADAYDRPVRPDLSREQAATNVFHCVGLEIAQSSKSFRL